MTQNIRWYNHVANILVGYPLIFMFAVLPSFLKKTYHAAPGALLATALFLLALVVTVYGYGDTFIRNPKECLLNAAAFVVCNVFLAAGNKLVEGTHYRKEFKV